MKARAARTQAARAQAPRAESARALRCATYTRKSTEHNLDLACNSRDAQSEACEAYIKSQAHEGWRLAPGRYDDGGLADASLDRPALRVLLDGIRVRRIDIPVVYKVDRLTRSLADFADLAKLVELAVCGPTACRDEGLSRHCRSGCHRPFPGLRIVLFGESIAAEVKARGRGPIKS